MPLRHLLAALLLAATSAPALAARDVMVVLDNSGSMQKNDPSRLAPQAISEFVRNQPADTWVGIIVFSTGAELAAPLAAVDTATLNTALRRLNYKGQWTQTAAAIERALYELRQEGRPGADKAI